MSGKIRARKLLHPPPFKRPSRSSGGCTWVLYRLQLNLNMEETKILYSESHVGWHFRKLKAQSSNISFATLQWQETFELWVSSFETTFEDVIGCTISSGLGHILFLWNTFYYTSTVRGQQECDSSKGGLQNASTTRGWRQTKDCRKTWSIGFQFQLGKYFSDERGLPFYYLKIGFLKYLRISGEIRYPNVPICYWNKATIWKEACIVRVGAIIHDY